MDPSLPQYSRKYFCRRIITLAALLLITFIFIACGFMAPPRVARYPQGIRFDGSPAGTRYHGVSWSRDPKNPQLCPLTIHLPGADLDAKKLANLKLLTSLGWSKQQSADGSEWMQYRRGNLVVDISCRDGILDSVWVNALTCPEPQEGIVSINGKHLTLPISEQELTRLLGAPQQKK